MVRLGAPATPMVFSLTIRLIPPLEVHAMQLIRGDDVIEEAGVVAIHEIDAHLMRRRKGSEVSVTRSAFAFDLTQAAWRFLRSLVQAAGVRVWIWSRWVTGRRRRMSWR